METTRGTVLSLLWQISKYPEAVSVIVDEHEPGIVGVRVHRDDLRHLNKNRVAIEAVLDRSLGRRIEVRFYSGTGAVLS